MDLNRVILEYGKAQLHIILLQEQLQSLNTKIAQLEKQLKQDDNTEIPPEVKVTRTRRRGIKTEEIPETKV